MVRLRPQPRLRCSAMRRDQWAKGQVCDGSQDLALINGKFLTLDDKNSVVSAVAIRNGRIAEVGRHAQAIGPCAQTINLREQPSSQASSTPTSTSSAAESIPVMRCGSSRRQPRSQSSSR